MIARARPAVAALSALAASGLAIGAASRFLSSSPVRFDDGSPERTFKGGPAFLSLPLESAEQVNHNTKRLRFKLPSPDAVSGLPVSSALLTITWPKGAWLPLPRPYTPISHPDERGHLDLLVKLYPEGRGSGYLHSLQPGDKLLFAASIPRPRWQPNAYRHVTLIAGGAGITPVFQLAQGILRGDPADRTAITLVFGINSDRDVLLRDELNDLERRFPDRFRAVYTVSHPEPGSPYAKGYVTRELLEKVVPAGDKTDTAVYVCGPPAMEKALVGKSGILEQVGWSKSQVHQF